MAAPKIGILGQVPPAAATAADAYTVPAARRAVLSSIAACNTSGADTTFRVHVRPGGAATAVGNAVEYDVTIYAGQSAWVPPGITLAAGDVVTVRSLGGGVTFTVFGEETDVPTS